MVSLAPTGALERAAGLLSGDERERAGRMPDGRIRRRYVLARAALRHLLGARLQVEPAALRFEYGERGKPLLAGAEFNLSHSGDLALIGISGADPIGVDVEQLAPPRRRDLLARRVLTDDERQLLRRCSDDAEGGGELLRFWTAKEAVAKALGAGLSLAPSRIAVHPAKGFDEARAEIAPAAEGPLADGAIAHRVVWLSGLDGAVAAVAAAETPPREWRRLDLDAALASADTA